MQSALHKAGEIKQKPVHAFMVSDEEILAEIPFGDFIIWKFCGNLFNFIFLLDYSTKTTRTNFTECHPTL